ncbi:hypothetical protein EMPS_07285 [Entomortierella parvispora]|uniref:Yeast cell wall synthesis Kre9/Knh1-like N-terminal domain-containing protein n=1 Tax=Entomortierella parvispora TaxID=205924 RepID=A0A9P3HEM6_9FUNG|nr:hypothetical protein EMPS_07285 [Entomortierella parvispora]
MKFTSLAVLGAFASIASAFVSPTAPIGETIWKPNTQATITWVDDGKIEPFLNTTPVFDVSFMTGSNMKMTKLSTIATNVTGNVTWSLNWIVPNVSPPGQIYFLQFETVDRPTPVYAWSTRFTITDAQGSAPPIPPPSITFSGNGSIIPTPTNIAATGASISNANPTATAAASKSGAVSLTASVLTVASAIGAVVMMAL